jgi:ribonuclease-3
MPDLDALTVRLGHSFRQPRLLLDALTHTSYAAEHAASDVVSNERLEFLGDAVLGLIASALLYSRLPAAPEGRLTGLRAELVRASTLANLARHIQLGPHLRLGRGEETTGGRERELLLARAMEAVIGALYLDGGMRAARHFLEPLLQSELESIQGQREVKDAKSLLQEHAQAQLGITPTYRVVIEEGPAHARRFVVEALVGEHVAGRGEGSSKRQAEQAAASAALRDEGWGSA